MSHFTDSIKRLKITPRRKVISLLVGGYTSTHKGSGLELYDIREYVFGDNVRDIDWNATARTNKPYVREFRESREMNVLFVVDTSSSMRIGNSNRPKKDIVVDFITLISFAAMQQNDPMGLVLYNLHAQKVIPFKKGGTQAREIVNSVYTALDSHFLQQTDHMALKKILLSGLKKKSLCFLITDAIDFDETTLPLLKALNQKHEVIVVKVTAEQRNFEKLPSMTVQDSETGEEMIISSSSKNTRKTSSLLKSELQRSNIGFVELFQNTDLTRAMAKFFNSYNHIRQ